ncbi:MAG: TIGR00341 family protein, partial [Candidatus Brocadiia bacterium]
MALRLIEMVCPEEKRHEVEELLEEHKPLGLWHDRLLDEQVLVKILLTAEGAEAVLDKLETTYGGMEGFRILLVPVEAALPRPDVPEERPSEAPYEGAPKHLPTRISRHELYSDISAGTRLTRVYLAMLTLSTVVAGIGMWRDNVAVIIGAMVIAPLLGPNMALAFATTLGDGKLGREALRTNLVGIGTGLAVATLMGLVLSVGGVAGPPIGPGISELLLRSQVCLADVVLALAAGSAGALAFTTGISTALVGVMVAVALLPPLAALGMTLGAGQWGMAAGAGLLFLTNLICINLAGVATFLAHGIRPRTWWEADKARRAARHALTVWVILLGALVVLIIVAGHWLQSAIGCTRPP